MPGYTVHESEVVAGTDGTVSVKTTIGAHVGAEQLEQHILRFAAGSSAPRAAADRDEVAYVVSGTGTLALDGTKYDFASDTGIYIRAGETYQIDNPGPDDIVLVSVTAPEAPDVDAAAPRKVTVRVADQPTIPAGKDREFRFVINPDAGCQEVTQFVGWIPPGRAPTHYHLYDEVIYVLDGDGVLHLEGEPDRPITTGTCIHLPPPTWHCLENTGDRPLRVLGVFHPAGSAAEAYEEED